MLKGKTPSLIGSSLGRPSKETCGRETPCSRCKQPIQKGDACFDVPQPQKPHASTRRFCVKCFRCVLEQTKSDVAEFECQLNGGAR
jgi:hypothetical protein